MRGAAPLPGHLNPSAPWRAGRRGVRQGRGGLALLALLCLLPGNALLRLDGLRLATFCGLRTSGSSSPALVGTGGRGRAPRTALFRPRRRRGRRARRRLVTAFSQRALLLGNRSATGLGLSAPVGLFDAQFFVTQGLQRRAPAAAHVVDTGSDDKLLPARAFLGIEARSQIALLARAIGAPVVVSRARLGQGCDQ